MKRINDIFYSLQGEGRNTGRAAVFVRFAGCNLRCPFCDTEFDSYREMSDEEIVADIKRLLTVEGRVQTTDGRRFVVLTGGEPTLQVDEAFVDLLHLNGFEVAMESNGTRPAPQNLDWLTVSPKALPQSLQQEGKWPDEIKVVFTDAADAERYSPTLWKGVGEGGFYLQPCDTGDPVRNMQIINRCVAYIKEHPEWRLSLQTHKLAGFK